ncbi:hypothetical protein ES708_27773 [subsurface metagenome]
MERIKELKIKAEADKRIADAEIKRLEQAEADKEVELMDERRAEVKLQAQLDHEAYRLEKWREQYLKNEANTPEAQMRKADQYATMITNREISRGLTKEQRAYKHMSEKDRRDCDNMIAQGEVRDIHGFLKKKRLKEEASDRRRRKLKGL